MKRLVMFLVSILIVAGIVFGSQSPALSQDAATFYKGKTVTFIVPYSAGGGYDFYARFMAPHLEKYTGCTIVIKNKPGGGGVVGANLVYRAKPDGRTIGILNMTGSIPAQIADAKGIDFDLKKFNWMARLNDEPQVFVVGAKSQYNSWDDILQSKETIKLSSTGTVGSTYLDLLVLKLVFDIKTFDIVTGFSGTSDADLSVIRGELVGTASSVSSKIKKIEAGDFKPLLVIADEKVKGLENIPLIYDFPMSVEGKKIADTYIGIMNVSRAMMMTPGVPADRVAFMREAFKKTLTDPDLVQKAEKMDRPVSWMDGEKVLKFIERSFSEAPPLFVNELKKTMK
jgi:tripartite-type tricarboxylate transporter receptor subunit TctC